MFEHFPRLVCGVDHGHHVPDALREPHDPRTVGGYGRLSLESLETRDVPATWFLQLTSAAAGIPGDTAATHAGTLTLAADLVNADTLEAALADAIAGTITVDFANQTVPNAFALGEGAPFRAAVDGSTVTLEFEDLVGMAGLTPDWDYNDRSWTLDVVELPTVSLVAIDPAMAEARASPDGPGPTAALVEFRRTGDLADALVVHYKLSGTATPAIDFVGLDPVGTVTFAKNEASVAVVLDALDDTAL